MQMYGETADEQLTRFFFCIFAVDGESSVVQRVFDSVCFLRRMSERPCKIAYFCFVHFLSECFGVVESTI